MNEECRTSHSPAYCLNCQAELALDESLYERHDPDFGIVSLPWNAQAGSCGMEGTMPGQSGNLFDIICNSTSALRGPICEDCTNHLLLGMDEQLKSLEEECASYRKSVEVLKDGSSARAREVRNAAEKLCRMKEEEESLKLELRKLEREESHLNEELLRKNEELKVVTEEDENLWRKFRNNHRRLLDMECDEQNMNAQLVCAKAQLERLANLNVLNTAFHIWMQGNFGTINGFRLGRLPHPQVEWTEINAAWGQTSLLFTVLMRRLNNFKLRDYEIYPMGNHSFIRCLQNNAELPLYGSGGFKPFGQKKFDEAMCAFLECFCQFQKHIENQCEFRLPHRMTRDHIEDNRMEYSVKMQFNSEERWTKAMKSLLINLRWAISYVVLNSPPQ